MSPANVTLNCLSAATAGGSKATAGGSESDVGSVAVLQAQPSTASNSADEMSPVLTFVSAPLPDDE